MCDLYKTGGINHVIIRCPALRNVSNEKFSDKELVMGVETFSAV